MGAHGHIGPWCGGAVTATGGKHAASGEGEGDREVAQTEGELTLDAKRVVGDGAEGRGSPESRSANGAAEAGCR